MKCRELVELVTDYFEGRMAGPLRARFDEHLMKCDGCQAYLDQMRKTIAMTGRLQPADVEPEARERLLEAFRGWRTRTA
jgi:predicted anti-sigma-YlaC factor YlaD